MYNCKIFQYGFLVVHTELHPIDNVFVYIINFFVCMTKFGIMICKIVKGLISQDFVFVVPFRLNYLNWKEKGGQEWTKQDEIQLITR